VEHGVEHNFTVTGGGAMHLNDALGHKEGLQCIYNHNEQGSAIAAEAYTRLTGKIASVCVTSGPGGTNAITGVIGGWLDSIPMFILSGQVKRETTIWSVPELQLRQLGDQEFDIVHSVANMTKYAVMVTEPQDIAYYLEKAWFLCQNGRGGPVWLDIPLDVQGAQIETDTLRHFDITECAAKGPMVTSETAKDVLEKIHNARAPLILVGTGVRLGNAWPELQQLIEKLDIPVVTAWNANDTVPYDDPHFVGMPGTVGTRSGNFVVQSCDVLLSLASRLNIRMISYNKLDFAKNAYKIIVDIDPVELKKPTIHPDMPVNADVKQFMQVLLTQSYKKNPAHVAWLKWCRNIFKKYPVTLPEYYGKPGNINPYVFLDKLFNQLTSEDVIACGNGSACVMTFQSAKIKKGQRMFTNSGCAAMGYGLPAALGQAVARKGKRVICIDGDGSIMMNIQEMATIVYNKLNIKIILLNNNGYHSIRQTQINMFHPPLVGVDNQSGVGFPEFAKLAAAFGFGYYRIEKESDAESVIAETLNTDGPVFCEVVVDPGQNFAPKLSSKVLPDGRIVSAELDEMFPFLPHDEYEAEHYFSTME
jgi:acetolactate synthase-1/2/3 large subunit